jgi:glyoxylase-like metal-dependent hydrolase (beta-lactamase superfamily II)
MQATPDPLSEPIGGYRIDLLFRGFPGKATHHGGLGWSSVVLMRGHSRTVLIDTGPFGYRRELVLRLAEKGVAPDQVTDLVLSHGHHDHMVNFPMFSNARIYVGARELSWALEIDPGVTPVPELYVQALSRHTRLVTIRDGDTVLPNITAHLAPGHTPGSLFLVLAGEDRDIIFTADAAKSRAELMSRQADMTLDAALSAATMEKIWSVWRRRAGSIVIPGHDAPLLLLGDEVLLLYPRLGGIAASFGDTLEDVTTIDLVPPKGRN